MKSQEKQQQRYGRLILAIVLVLLGGVALWFGSQSFAIYFVGLVAIMASVYLVRSSQIRARSRLSATGRPELQFKKASGPKRWAWGVGAGLFVALAVSYLWMYNDAIHGGKSGLRAYVFGGIALVAAPFFGYRFRNQFGGAGREAGLAQRVARTSGVEVRGS